MIDLAGQAVIVTGAGRGLGRHYAVDLASRGAMVLVNDLGTDPAGGGRDGGVAQAVVDEIVGSGGQAVASADPVDSADGAAAIVQRARDAFGRVDAVVSNAGIFQTAPFEDISVEQWERMRAVHLDGGFHLAQHAYRLMKDQGYGRFVFIASSAGLFGQPDSAHYAAAKAGLLGLANVIAIEGAAHGITANLVLPFGFSRMVTGTAGDADEARAASEFLRSIEPELVVPLVVYLASRSCELTHHVFSACAGRFARVFVGLAEGWAAERGVRPSAEDVETHLEAITSPAGYTIPTSIFDEVEQVCLRLGITS